MHRIGHVRLRHPSNCRARRKKKIHPLIYDLDHQWYADHEMKDELTPVTPEGAEFLRRARSLVPLLREQAAIADRDNQMSRTSFNALQDAGIPAAFVPSELGGLGITSIQDWLAGIAMLGRGDGSVAIAISMHWGSESRYYPGLAGGTTTGS